MKGVSMLGLDNSKIKLLSIFILTVLFVLLASETSKAIPAFSRKYKTSCATCHIAFPKLSAFGEAFRRNGYQFPNGGDAEATKEEPVSIGAEGNKRAFPDAIWPSTIPGSVPVSIVAELEATYAPKEPQKWDFSPLEGEFALIAGGTIGDNIAFLSEVEVVDDAIEIERANIIFNNLDGGNTAMLNLKIGKFEPGVFSFSNHRRISPKYGILTNTLGDNKWSLEATQKGIEVNGVVGDGRLGYNVGLVEGRKNVINSQKDYYVHLAYKISGMRLDGVVPEDAAVLQGASQPWQDNSLTIGGFVYRGSATLDGSPAGVPDVNDDFTMVGGDVNIWYDRLNLISAFAIQSDEKPLVGRPTLKSDLTSFMVEASYIVYPWLVPLARYESSKMKDATNSDTKIISAIQFLVRANVRFALEFNFANDLSSSNPSELSFKEFAVGITLGF